jgi:hypothetical protein
MPSLVQIDEIPTTNGWGSSGRITFHAKEATARSSTDGSRDLVLTASLEHGRAFSMFTATGREYRGRACAREARVDALGRRARHHAARDHQRRDEAPMLAISAAWVTNLRARVEY